jgi:hypothetical protein
MQKIQLAEIRHQGPVGHQHHSPKGEAQAVEVGKVKIEVEIMELVPRCVDNYLYLNLAGPIQLKKSTNAIPTVPLDKAVSFTPVSYDPPIQQAPRLQQPVTHPLAQQPVMHPLTQQPVTYPLTQQPPSMGQQPLSAQQHLSVTSNHDLII